jgi:hypothetical protein
MVQVVCAPAQRFDWGPVLASSLVRVCDVYPTASQFVEGGDTFLVDSKCLSWEDIAQGTHPDCFFVSAVTALAHVDPSLIAACFVHGCEPIDLSSPSRTYTCRFFRDGAHSVTQVDDDVPLTAKGEPLLARSPTDRWWPLLLEKAYAAFYGGLHAVAGGNVAECLHDLTGAPVCNIQFGNAANPTGEKLAKEDWAGLASQLRRKEIAVCAGTLKSFTGMPGTGFGLQPGHAYAVVGIHEKQGFAVLINPNKQGKYAGPLNNGDPKFSSAMRKAACITERRTDWFAIPLPVLIGHFTGLVIADLTAIGGEKKPSVLRGSWGGPAPEGVQVVSGCTSFKSFTFNQKFVARNFANKPVKVTFVLRQEDQRVHVDATREIKYLPAGINVMRRVQNTAGAPPVAGKVPATLEKLVTASPFVTPTTFVELVKAPRYLNQRDVSATVLLPPGESLVTPAAYFPMKSSSDAVNYTLLTYAGSSGSVRVLPQQDVWPSTACVSTEFSACAGDRVDFRVSATGTSAVPSDTVVAMHLCVLQGSLERIPSAPDVVSSHYLSLSLLDEAGSMIDSTVTINYGCVSLTSLLDAGSDPARVVRVAVAKGAGSQKFRLLVTYTASMPNGAEFIGSAVELSPVDNTPLSADPVVEAPLQPTPPTSRPATKRLAAGPPERPTKAAPRAAQTSKQVPAGAGTAAVRAAKAGSLRSVAEGGRATNRIAGLYAGLE